MLTESGLDNLLGMGGGGVLGAVATAVGLFLRARHMERKAGRETTTLDKPAEAWLKSFLEAMTEDRRELKELFRELAEEIRYNNRSLENFGHRQEVLAQGEMNALNNLGGAMIRVEQKTDALLQRRAI